MILKLCLSRALEFLGNTDLLLRTYSYFGCPWYIKRSALEQDPLGTFSRVLGPEDQKKEWKEPEIDACDILEESSRYKCTYDDDIIIRYLTKERVSKNCQLVHSQDNWASASLLHFRHFTVYSSPVDTLLKCCWHSIQKYGQQLNPN